MFVVGYRYDFFSFVGKIGRSQGFEWPIGCGVYLASNKLCHQSREQKTLLFSRLFTGIL
jgi:hypothetical protein